MIQTLTPCPLRISPCIKYFIQECYDPYYSEYWFDNNYYEYTFVEWYFFLYNKNETKKLIKLKN